MHQRKVKGGHDLPEVRVDAKRVVSEVGNMMLFMDGSRWSRVIVSS